MNDKHMRLSGSYQLVHSLLGASVYYQFHYSLVLISKGSVGSQAIVGVVLDAIWHVFFPPDAIHV